jgi:adenylate cyclase
MRLRVRTVLVAAMLSLLLVTVAVLSVASYVAARDAATSLVAQVMAQAAGRTEDGARHLLAIAADEGAFDASMLASGQVDPRDQEAVAAYLLRAIEAHAELSSLSWVRDDTAELVEVTRARDGSISYCRQATPIAGGANRRRFVVERRVAREIAPVFDPRSGSPRTRPYYAAALRANAPTWTETYTFIGEDARDTVLGVTRATPVRDDAGALLGVLSADFDLYALSEFVRGLDVSPHGFAFVVELRRDGARRVIAAPDPRLLVDAAGEPVAAERVADPRVHALLRALDATSVAAQPGQLVPVSFAVDGVPHLGGYRVLRAGDLRWALAIALPEDDVLGPLRATRRMTLLVTVAATALAVLVAIVMGVRFGGALRALALETERVGRFQLDPRPIVASSVVEVRQLSAAIEDMKRGLRSFRKFVPADIVRRLLASGDEAMQGGRRQTITVHVSDIAGFTSFSETLSPEALVELLCEYLSLVSEEIVASGGTLDKYIGDAVMAFWNAPSPVEDHAFVACRTALENRRRVASLRTAWTAAGRPEIACRVGIHTGEAVVGNVGSDARLDFTAIGDSVNLASRLEGLGKMYGVDLVISETTRALAGDRVVTRPLDRVAVKGREAGILIHELIGLAEDVGDEERRAADRHADALAAYFEQRWDDALAILARARAGDGPTVLLVETIAELRAKPPAHDWDGVRRMTTK